VAAAGGSRARKACGKRPILSPHFAKGWASIKANTIEIWTVAHSEAEEAEVDGVEQEIRQKEEEAAEKARFVARWEAKKDIEARQRARKRYEEEEKLKDWVQQHPGYGWSAATAVCSPNNDRKKKIPRRPPQPSPHSRSTKSPPPAPHRCAKKLMT
jgi:hypothetical protein